MFQYGIVAEGLKVEHRHADELLQIRRAPSR